MQRAPSVHASFSEMCIPRDFANASPFPRLQLLAPQKIQKWRLQRRRQKQQQQRRRRRCL
jgi:hypothetical protein